MECGHHVTVKVNRKDVMEISESAFFCMWISFAKSIGCEFFVQSELNCWPMQVDVKFQPEVESLLHNYLLFT